MRRFSLARTLNLLCFTMLINAVPVVAQPASTATPVRGEPVVAEKAGKELLAHYIGDTPPRIDGRLDEEGWAQARAIEDMVQNDPNNMQPPTERTVVKVLYDDRTVYVGGSTTCAIRRRSPPRLAAATRFRAVTRSRLPSIRVTIT